MSHVFHPVGAVAEARRAYDEAKRLDQILDGLEKKADRTNPKLSETLRLAYGLTAILRRMGLPEDVEAAITMINRAIAAANMLRASLIAVTAASGPWGTAAALVGVAGSAMALQMELTGPRYA